jgi:hypothetical protein
LVFVELAPTESTSADETASIVVSNWICRFGIPEVIVCDGGPDFRNTLFSALCRAIGTELHITTAAHPQSHGPVERANAVIVSTIRASIRREPRWTRLLPFVQFAVNTAVSRSTGVSPCRALFGFTPSSPLSHALQQSDAPQLDPLEHVASFCRGDIQRRVADAEQKAFSETCRQFKRNAAGRTDFDIGDYVLLHDESAAKLAGPWSGPFIVVDREANGVIYSLQSVADESDVRRVHVNRLFIFDTSGLTNEQLARESLRVNEFVIDKVFEHDYASDGRLWFRVSWLGYPDYPPSSVDAWVAYDDSHWSPTVRAYVSDHSLPTKVAPSAPAARPKGRRKVNSTIQDHPLPPKLLAYQSAQPSAVPH